MAQKRHLITEKENLFTKEEVVDLLLKERKRATDIAYCFKKKYDLSYKSKERAKNKFAFIDEDIANTCRLVGNTISGLNALSISLGETERSLIEEEIENHGSNR